MPELRSRTVLADPSSGGFFIRKVTSPGAVVEKGAVKPLARRIRTLSSNKKNEPPVWAVWTAPERKSSLPEWYPRSPLRDITSVVKAVERKSRLREAAARQQIQWIEDSSESLDLTPPVQTDQGAQETLAVVASGQVVANASTAATSSSDCSLQTPSKPNDPALALVEKKLTSSIEQIEKMVSRDLKRTLKVAQPSKPAIQRRTLMSMR